jgi:hypothetical protein
MKSTRKIQISATILSVAIASVAFAQRPTDFPDEQVKKTSCTDFNWNADMAREHPRMVSACQEVVVVNGVNWARLAASFTRVNGDGAVNFEIRDQRNRFVEDVTLEPRVGQVAYINDRPTAFDHLRTTDSINLYVPEGQYGYATRPGVAAEEVAMAAPTQAMPLPADTNQQQALADNSAPPAMLPQTASDVPLLALGGLLSLFGGLVLTLRRLGS